jgi:hypothetical protein
MGRFLLSVLAVELRTVSDGFVIKLRDGRNLRCVQNNPRVLRLRDSAPHHAIVLKMEDGSGLLLPIIVSMYLFLLGHDSRCFSNCVIYTDMPTPTSYSGDTKHYATGCPSEHSNRKSLL